MSDLDPVRPLAPLALARGTRSAVVAPHHLATAAGLAVLADGGTAVDAAIATNAALAVVMPSACGLGGDAFWLIWDEAAGRLVGLNGSGRAPARADPAALRAAGHAEIPARGPLSITVPGAVRSWADAHARLGRLPIDRLLAPAIDLAERGFAVSPAFAQSVERLAGELHDEPWAAGFGAVFRPTGRAWQPGETIRLAALAGTLRELATDGLSTFYDGRLGERQARALAAAGGSFTAADFRGHVSTWTEPIETTYRGIRVASHPPNSSGVVALELLNLLETFEPPERLDLAAALARGEGPGARWIHLGAEAAKLAMADRDAHLTDPEAREVPVAWLLDKARASELAAGIDPDRAAAPPPARNPRGGGTVFLATVDGAGNAVALIESNWLGFGSGVVDPETGIHYHDRGAFFSLDPDHPNVLAPGKRTLHTLVPAMLFRPSEARPWVVLGSMGGNAQPQIVAQLVSAIVDGGADVAAAVSGPRWFVEPAANFGPPRALAVEPRVGPDVQKALAAKGHPLVPTAAFDSHLGHAHAIELVDGGPAAGASLAAATDPRSEGLPAVR